MSNENICIRIDERMLNLARSARIGREALQSLSHPDYPPELEERIRAMMRQLVGDDLISGVSRSETGLLADELANQSEQHAETVLIHDDYCMTAVYEQRRLTSVGSRLLAASTAMRDFAEAMAQLEDAQHAERLWLALNR